VASDEARQARALESIANSVKEVARVLVAMNENLVVAARDLAAMKTKTEEEPDGA
jgi:hypothetical protein